MVSPSVGVVFGWRTGAAGEKVRRDLSLSRVGVGVGRRDWGVAWRGVAVARRARGVGDAAI